MTEREQFEKWAQEARLNIAKIDIGYLYSSTEDAWMGWQARATPALPQGVEECQCCGYAGQDIQKYRELLQSAAIPEGMVIVPVDAIPAALPMEPFQTIDKSSKNYKAGWNACRLAMLAAKEAIECTWCGWVGTKSEYEAQIKVCRFLACCPESSVLAAAKEKQS